MKIKIITIIITLSVFLLASCASNPHVIKKTSMSALLVASGKSKETAITKIKAAAKDVFSYYVIKQGLCEKTQIKVEKKSYKGFKCAAEIVKATKKEMKKAVHAEFLLKKE